MKSAKYIVGLLSVAFSALGVGAIMYILFYSGVALDENISYVEFFDKVGNLEWLIFLMFILLFLSTLTSLILMAKQEEKIK